MTVENNSECEISVENSNIFNSAEDALRAKELLELLKVIERTKKGNMRNEIYK